MRPSAALLSLAALWLGLALAVAWSGALLDPWAGAGLALLALGVIDALRCRSLPLPELTRTGPASLALGAWAAFKVTVRNPSTSTARLALFDGYPTVHEVRGLPQDVIVRPGEGVELTWRLRPLVRGPFEVAPAEALLSSPWRLWRRPVRLGTPTPFRVYPDFRQVMRYALLATDDRVAAMGIHQRRRRGEGLEFFQLREYRPGDALRQIDWKATSRRAGLVSREYQDEQNQQLVFLLDCGSRLRAEDGELTHFDHALNAMLLLTYVALRQGDAVGLMTFSGPERWVAPHRGRGQLRVLQDQVYDLQSTLAPSDYREAASRLMTRQRRRALVVVLTNLKDEDNAELKPAIATLKKKHLVLVTSLREASLGQLVEQPVADLKDALRFTSALHFLEQRRAAHERLRGQGVFSLDVEPLQLPVALVNQYLDIKSAGLL